MTPIPPKAPHPVTDWGGESIPLTDVLHQKVRRPQKCGSKCLGSTMDNQGLQSANPLPLEDMLVQAEDFMAEYYRDKENHGETEVEQEERVAKVQEELRSRGYYRLTGDELEWGARTAWRNADRCPACMVWK